MGARKRKWTDEEEGAIRAGIEKYGPGKWRAIQRDAKFGPCLTSRSNIDLKDKWRNLTASTNGLGFKREQKSLVLKVESGGLGTLMEEAAAVTPLPSLSPSGDSKPLLLPGSGQKSSDLKSLGPRYDDNVVLGLKDTNCFGNATIAIDTEQRHREPSNYIQERHQVPSNFLPTSKLRDLAISEKLFEVKQNYEVPANKNENDAPSEGRPAVKSTGPIRSPERLPDEIRRSPRFPTGIAKKMRDYTNSKKRESVVDAEVTRSRMKTAWKATRTALQAVAEAETAAAAAEEAARAAEIAEAEADAAEAAADRYT